MNLFIRDAKLEDAPHILEIFSYYLENTAIAFEYDPPSLTEFQNRMKHIMEKYPYLVIEQDGRVEGYAYASPFVGRAAYDWACEMTIYLDPNAQKCGMGRTLYTALEDRLKAMGIINLYACIGYPTSENDAYLTTNSAEFHAHLGYKEIGRFHKCGYKFGNWLDMIWMEKIIGTHDDAAQAVIPYPVLKERLL